MDSGRSAATLGDENDPRAYIRLAAELRRDIVAGKHQPGQPIPSITTLSARHGHARMTVSKSLGVLVDEGLIIRYPGLGYHVARHNPGLSSAGN